MLDQVRTNVAARKAELGKLQPQPATLGRNLQWEAQRFRSGTFWFGGLSAPGSVVLETRAGPVVRPRCSPWRTHFSCTRTLCMSVISSAWGMQRRCWERVQRVQSGVVAANRQLCQSHERYQPLPSLALSAPGPRHPSSCLADSSSTSPFPHSTWIR